MATVSRRDVLAVTLASIPLSSLGSTISKGESGRSVRVDARPDSIGIDVTKTAILVVDMQNDFGAKGGLLDRAGIDITPIRTALDPIARVLRLARLSGMHVVYLKMAYRPDLSDLGTPESFNRKLHIGIGVGQSVTAPDGSPSRLLIRDTWNTDILSELKPQYGDTVLYKTRFSGFYNTDLHQRLIARDIRYLVFTGCTTSVCVESTVRDAMFRDYVTLLLADCMAEPLGSNLARTNHDATLFAIAARFGWVSDSARFAGALGG